MQEQLGNYREAINDALRHFFAELPEILDLELSKQSKDALQKIEEYSLRPGKRIRGALACFAYDYATGEEGGKKGIQAAVALELVQNYLLIVDDVMDRSTMRRGKPTVHELYLAEQTVSPKDTHLANMLAINVGLITQHLVNIVLAQIDESPERVQRAVWLLHKNITATGFGQIDDACQQAGLPFTEQDILRKYTLKSGYYTFVCPLQVGLVLGGKTDPNVLQEVTEFGLAAGIGFQLQDDLLGVFAEMENTGKPNTDDLEEGKYTLLIQYALAHTTDSDREFLIGILGRQNISEAELAKAQKILRKCGSEAYTREKAREYAEQAKQHVAKSTFWDQNSKRLLTDIVDYTVDRKR